MKRFLVTGLVLLIVVLPGCGKDGKAPKELAVQVIECLKNKEINAYIDLCVTKEDKRFLIAASDLTLKEKTAQTALLSNTSRDIYEIKDVRISNFNDIASAKNMEKAVVRKIILRKKINEHGIISYDEVIVKFKDNMLPDLMIRKVVKVKDKWKIMDNEAMAFMSMI